MNVVPARNNGKQAAIFRLTFLCQQAANFDIFELIKIFLDFNNVKVSNKVVPLLHRNNPYQNEYITLLYLNYNANMNVNVKIYSYLATHAN